MTDSDNDGIEDDQENCSLATNGPLIPDAGGNNKLDTVGDDYGNACDADLNGSGFVDFTDLTTFANLLFQPPGPSCCVP